MPQIFRPSQLLWLKLCCLGLLALIGGVLAISFWSVSGPVSVGMPPQQPIPFSHKHHVGDDGIDCRYCHTSVETSSFAGLPSTQICLTCHSQLFKDAPLLKPLHDSAASGHPIAWKRVHDLPDYVYFDHSIHVNKGVACIECHGRVDQMPLTFRTVELRMKWCIACHENPGPHLHPPQEIYRMQWPTDPDPARVRALLGYYGTPDRRRLTDCSSCHR